MTYEKTHFGLLNNQTENGKWKRNFSAFLVLSKNSIVNKTELISSVSEDFWSEMFQWSFLKVFAIITGLLTSFGLYPIMLNIIEYNNNRHIR